MTLATFETFGAADLQMLAEAEAELGITVTRRDAPTGDERGLVVEHRDLTRETASLMPRLRAIYLLDGGRATLPASLLDASGIALRHVPNLGGLGVAEHVFALLLALKKQLLTGHQRVVASDWRDGVTEPLYTGQREYTFNWSGVDGIGWLYGETLGIIGFGRIGQAVARRALAFDMRVLYYNRQRLLPAEERRLDVEYAPLDDLVAVADAVTLHLPFTSDSEHILDAARIARLKSSALVINTARGRVVDEDALATALRERRIAGAGLDVLVYEPPARDNPLLTLDNVIFTPHTAGIYNPIARRAQLQTALRWWREDSAIS